MSDPTSKIRSAQLQLKKLIPEDLYPALECSPNSKKPADLEKIKRHREQVVRIAKRLSKSSGPDELDDKTKKKLKTQVANYKKACKDQIYSDEGAVQTLF